MELYLLDYNFQRDQVIDTYKSLIWTERFSAHGDFTLTMKYNRFALYNLRSNYGLAFSESNRLMMIENIDVPKPGTPKHGLMTITGRSFEAFLENRSMKRATANGKPEKITGNAGNVARQMVWRHAVDPTIAGAANVIPNFTVDEGSPPTRSFTMFVPRDDIYTVVKKLCDGASIGFGIRLDRGKLAFYVYTGVDKSDKSTSYYQVFSEDNETLVNESYLESIAKYKNHARVIGAKRGVDVYAPGVDASVSGLDRRTLVVEAGDVGGDAEDTVAEQIDELERRGIAALADQANKHSKIVDGDVPQNKWNETHYGLGDIVMVKSIVSEGSSLLRMKIVENIWSIDATGARMYPTFETL